MKTTIKRRFLRFVIILTVLLAALTMLTRRERARIEGTATRPGGTAAEGPLDGQAIHADLQRLSGPEFDGRRTGTAGSRLAQGFIVERFKAVGAAPAFGDSYRQPFGFTRRSIRGLLSGGPFTTEYPEATNVGALLRGTEFPDRYIALSAHYDHFGTRDGNLFPGADDNASGIAVLLAVGKLLSERRPRHTILLLAWDAEELGLRGARHFVANPPLDLKGIQVLVNLDMVGRGDDNTVVAAGTSHYPHLQGPVRDAAASRSIRVMFGHDRPLYQAGRVDDWTYSSDHGPFHDAGVPFLYLGVQDHADYHQPTDTADKIDPAFLGQVANLVHDLLRNLDRLGGPR